MSDPKVIIYTHSRMNCPYCDKAKATLAEWAVEYTERDLSDPIVKNELREKRPGARSMPQIFLINDYYIGGCSDLITMGQARLQILLELT